MWCLCFLIHCLGISAFLSRCKHLLISWLQSPSTVILEPKKIVCNCFRCFPIHLPWNDGTRCHALCCLNVEFKQAFSLSSFTFIKRLFSSSSLSAFFYYIIFTEGWRSNSLATWWKSGLTGRDHDAGRDGRQEKKGIKEEEMVGWHLRFNGWVWASSGRWWRKGETGLL